MEEGKRLFLVKIKRNIGNINLENNLLLAPMAGITDLPFRLICKKFGVGLMYTEMISAKALMYDDSKTKLLLETVPEERPIAVQIFGSDIKAIEYAVKYLNDKAEIIDINMGCPAPKVIKNGDGSKLLLDLNLVSDIVKVAVANAKVPITVKMRIGWDNDHIVGLEAAKIIEEAGASAITVHGRTRSQFYSGTADWEIIKKIKENANIPIIGNGDIKSRDDAIKMQEYSKVDGIMIGRAAFGNPWIFSDTKPNKDELLKIILEHIDLACKYKREDVAIKEMRKHISAYTKGLKNSSEIRAKINTLATRKEVEDNLKEFFKNL